MFCWDSELFPLFFTAENKTERMSEIYLHWITIMKVSLLGRGIQMKRVMVLGGLIGLICLSAGCSTLNTTLKSDSPVLISDSSLQPSSDSSVVPVTLIVYFQHISSSDAAAAFFQDYGITMGHFGPGLLVATVQVSSNTESTWIASLSSNAEVRLVERDQDVTLF